MIHNRPLTTKYDVIQMRAMNSEFAIYAKSENPMPEWKSDIVLWFSHFEQLCSRFLPTSFLAQFNQMKSDQPIIVPELFYQAVFEAWEYAKRTDTLFNPFVGDSMEAIGYTHSFTPDFTCEINDKQPLCSRFDEDALIFYPHMKAIEKRSMRKLDLGGIGKGWSVEQAGLWLKEHLGIRSGLVDGAGDLYVWSEENDSWLIGIENPFNQEQELVKLRIASGAITTSNKLYRRWQQGAFLRHHIINGQTGLPADSEVVQATVIGTSATEAEVVAKVLCMLPFAEIEQWMEKHFTHLAYVLVLEDGRLEMSRNMGDQIIGIEVTH